jgi:hypothetical protein
MTSASLLILLMVGTIVGALTGLVAGPVQNGLYVAILSGFLGTILAGIAHNLIIVRGAGKPDGAPRTPAMVLVYSAIASLAGSSAAMEVARLSDLQTSSVWIGTLAGLFSGILMAMLMITYYTHPGEPPRLRTAEPRR